MHLPRRLIRRVGTVPRAVVRSRRRRPALAFDLFTERTRDAMALAQDEARRLGHDFVGTEHILLGTLRRSDSVGAGVLAGMGVRLSEVRAAVESDVGRGPGTPPGEVRMTPRAKRVLELSVDEAKRLRHNYVGTEHLLLGIVREGEGVAARILGRTGVAHDRVRAEVRRLLGP